jgi:hypothetical protein
MSQTSHHCTSLSTRLSFHGRQEPIKEVGAQLVAVLDGLSDARIIKPIERESQRPFP